jgi:hypothetical protein
MQTNLTENSELARLQSLYQALEQRMTLLESKIEVYKGKTIPLTEISEPEIENVQEKETNDSIEYNIGESGMAWMGNIVLFFGLIFLFQYLQNSGMSLLSFILGFLSVAAIFTASKLMSRSFNYMANLFYYTGHLLLYFMVLRLHFFTTHPVITEKSIGIILPMIVIGIQTYLSVRKKLQVLGAYVLLLTLVTGIISNTNQFLLFTTVLTTLLTIYYLRVQGWSRLLIPFMTLIYLTQLIWLLNNPLMGNPSGGLTAHHYGYLYLFACGLAFSLISILPRRETFSDGLLVTSIIWNAAGFTVILLLTVLNFFSNDYIRIFALIAAFCIGWSFLLQAKAKLKITASIYALYAFVAISITIYGIYKLPDSFFLLSWQSLLVVSMALWFRSRFIVVMNTFLFASLLIAYLKGGEMHNTINFSFALVALLTARIINWKQDRLKIKTEFLRNINLITGFLMTLYSLYHAVPRSYVTVSWVSAGIIFLVLSILINNIKYRWLAIASIISSAIYLFVIDLSKIGIGYRVVAFMFLAIISIGFSIFYSKRLKQKKESA